MYCRFYIVIRPLLRAFGEINEEVIAWWIQISCLQLVSSTHLYNANLQKQVYFLVRITIDSLCSRYALEILNNSPYCQVSCHSVHHLPPFCWGGGGVEPPVKFSKMEGEGLDRTSIFRGGLLGKRSDCFQGGCNFYIKNKLKSEI